MTFGRLNVLGSLGKLYGGGAGGGAFSWANAEGAAFEAQADGTGWDDALRGDIDQLISDLKSGQVNGSNTYSGFDRILLMDLPNQSDSLRYLNAPNLTATAVNGPAFTATEGFTGDGSAAYIDTGYSPAANGVQWSLNAASVGVWVRGENSANSQYYAGGGDAGVTNLTGLFEGSSSKIRPHGPNGGGQYDSALSGVGLWGVARSSSGAQQVYKNGTSAASGAGTSTSITVSQLYLLAINNNGAPSNFGVCQLSAFFAGRSFTANEWADIYDAFNRYRTAREAA